MDKFKMGNISKIKSIAHHWCVLLSNICEAKCPSAIAPDWFYSFDPPMLSPIFRKVEKKYFRSRQ